jgi:predicted ester cyclase
LDEHKAVVRRYFEGDHDGRDNTEIWDEICTPDMALVAAIFPPVQGLPMLKQFARGMHDAMTGFGITVDDMVAEDDQVAARWTMRGTHAAGPLPLPDGSTLPASGRTMEITGMSFLRMEEGRLAEERVEADWIGFLSQLGAMPPG